MNGVHHESPDPSPGHTGALASESEHSLLATAIIDGNLRIRSANRRWRELLASETLAPSHEGRTLEEFLPAAADAGDPLRAALLQAASANRSAELAEYPAYRPDGTTAWWRCFITPVPTSHGPPDLLLHVVDLTAEVTARQQQAVQAEAARIEQRILHALMSYIPAGVIVADAPEANIRMVSQYGCHLAGRNREELEGTSVRHPEAWQLYRADGTTPFAPNETPLARAIRQGDRSFDEDLVVKQPDGNTVFISANAGPIRDEQGNITGGIAVWRDVTDRKRAADQLRQSEENYRQLVQAAGCIILRMDREGRVTFFNEYAQEFFGFSDTEVLGQSVVGLIVPPAERNGRDLQAYIEDLTRHPEQYSYHENENVRKDGQRVVIAWSNRPVLGLDGQLQEILSVGLDITQRKRIEEQFERTRTRLNVLIETSMQVVAEKSLQGLLQTVAEASRSLTNARVSISGHSYGNGQFIVGGASRQEGYPLCPSCGVLKISRGGVYLDLFERHSTIRLTDEQLRQHPAWWGLPHDHTPLRGLLGARLVNADGRPIGLLMVSDKEEGDFTEEDEGLLQQLAVMTSLALQHIEARTDAERRAQEAREAEVALRESEERFRLAIENYPSAFAIYDAQRRVQFVNAVALQLADRSEEEILGRTDEGIFPPEVTNAYLPLLQRAMATRTRQTGECVINLPRQTLVAQVTYVPLLDEQGEIKQLLGIAYDVTDLKRAEAELKTLNEALERRVAERTAMAERRAVQLRAMAWEVTQAEQRERRRLAQVLHDHLQQLLVASRLKVSLLQRRVGEESLRRMTEDLDDLLNQAIGQSRSLTAELSPPVLYDAGLIAALDWLARETLAKHGLHVEVEADRAAEPTAEDTRVLLFETARELLFNVVKHAHAEFALVLLSLANADQVRLEVVDEGAGFDPARLSATETSPSGLGLFSIRERLELLGGNFQVDSAPGRGTHVTVLAPRHPPPRAAKPLRPAAIARPPTATVEIAPAHPAPSEAGKIRVLLADDHAIVRQGLASLLLEEPDIDVIGEASDGEEAVDMALRLQPDVVLMDVTMPKIDGVEATRRITRQLPQTHVIGLSMHQEADLATAMRGAGATAYLSKTGPADILVDTIHQHSSTSAENRA